MIKIKEKILLVLLGILLALILVELGLRIGGLIIEVSKNNNRITTKTIIKLEENYRILTLGESTTENNGFSWPEQLSEILNEKKSDINFEIINKGRGAVDTTRILFSINEYLEYRPDMVITMMGVNDIWSTFYYNESEKTNIYFQDIRTYKLFKLLKLHINEKINKLQNSIYKDNENKILEWGSGWLYQMQTKYNKTEEVIRKEIEMNPNNDEAYFSLGWYLFKKERYQEAEDYFRKATEMNPSNSNAYVGLAFCYHLETEFDEAENRFRKVIELNPNNDEANAGLGVYSLKKGRYKEAEDYFRKATEMNPSNKLFHELLIYSEYLRQNKEIRDENLTEKKISLDKNISKKESLNISRNENTKHQYQILYKILKERGIKLVVMQYPMRDIQEFKDFFDEEQQKGIIFISNKENFENALENSSYDTLFIDRFARDFGHCTVKGNRLIAENAAENVLGYLNITK